MCNRDLPTGSIPLPPAPTLILALQNNSLTGAIPDAWQQRAAMPSLQGAVFACSGGHAA